MDISVDRLLSVGNSPASVNLPSVLRTAGHVEWSTVALGPVIDRSVTIPVGERMAILMMTVGHAVFRRSVLHVAKLTHLREDSFVFVKFGTLLYGFTIFKQQMPATLSTVFTCKRFHRTRSGQIFLGAIQIWFLFDSHTACH